MALQPSFCLACLFLSFRVVFLQLLIPVVEGTASCRRCTIQFIDETLVDLCMVKYCHSPENNCRWLHLDATTKGSVQKTGESRYFVHAMLCNMKCILSHYIHILISYIYLCIRHMCIWICHSRQIHSKHFLVLSKSKLLLKSSRPQFPNSPLRNAFHVHAWHFSNSTHFNNSPSTI